MLRHSLSLFIGLCRRRKAFFALSAICLICAFVSFLYLQEKGYCAYLEAAKQHSETRLFYVSSDDSATILKTYYDVADNEDLPPFGIVTMSDENCSGIYWDRAYADVYYIPYGHFFTDTEMAAGDHVALLGMSYIQSMPKDQIDGLWDSEIIIGNKPFKAVGNYNNFVKYPVEEGTYQTEPLPTVVAIPLNTYLAMSMPATHLRIEFSQSLSAAQIAILNQIVVSQPKITCSLLPKMNDRIATQAYIAVTTQYALILLLSLISIINIVFYWVRTEFVRYRIYLLCGANRKQIVMLLSMKTIYLVTGTFLISILISWILSIVTPAGIVAMLPAQTFILIYLGLICCLLLMVNIKASAFIFRKDTAGKGAWKEDMAL